MRWSRQEGGPPHLGPTLSRFVSSGTNQSPRNFDANITAYLSVAVTPVPSDWRRWWICEPRCEGSPCHAAASWLPFSHTPLHLKSICNTYRRPLLFTSRSLLFPEQQYATASTSYNLLLWVSSCLTSSFSFNISFVSLLRSGNRS